MPLCGRVDRQRAPARTPLQLTRCISQVNNKEHHVIEKVTLFVPQFSLLYIFAFLSRRALVITDTDEKLMAAAAMMGLSKIPNNGYRAPAATGTPTEL